MNPIDSTPELAFIDSHVHFWNLQSPEISYDWLAPAERHPSIGDIDGLKVQRFAADEFGAINRFQNVTKAVHVGVSTNVDSVVETEWLQAMADRCGFPNGIVARCDLAAPDAAETLSRHMASPNMRGVRDNGTLGSFDDPAWRKGYIALGNNDLVFCHQVGVDRVAEAIRLVTDLPETTFSLDHTCMPTELSSDYFERWRDGIDSIAEHQNVVVKISAFGQFAGRWTLDTVRPWVDACLDAFGPDRAYFGSNFPVDGLFANYSDLINAYRELVSARPVDDQRKILAGNAERIYRL